MRIESRAKPFDWLYILLKIFPHFEVALLKKIAHIDWLLFVEKNATLKMRRDARK